MKSEKTFQVDRIKLLNQYLEKSPDDAFLNHALALEYIKAGKDEQAISLFENLLKDHPDYVGSYYHLGKALERKSQQDKAIEIYEKGMQIATKLKDQHAKSELQAAYDDLMY